ncbi:MAG: Gfo/Idh/MocA family oxidoreductase [Candidatus Scalindua sp.]|jgi:predicted dehydrogenase|nr:Gfo/Idh/MocA family oxidoreductase [Candidatus Scalindua sp.]
MIERLLIVGLGSIGTRHVRLAREILPEVEIIVLRHKSCNDIQNTDIDLCVTTLEDALKFKPQAAVIANPASHHLDIAIPLAEAGIHLLIEKPISSSIDDVSNLIDICKDRNLILMTGYNLRFLASLQQFREFIVSKRVGQVLSVRAEIGQYLPSWRPGSDYRQTVSAKSALGGGVLLELSHEIDYLRWLFGEIEWVSAKLKKQSELDIDVEDTAHLVIGFENNEQTNPVLANLNMDFIRHDTTRTCTVICENGTLRWNAMSGVVDVFEQGASEWQILFTEEQQRDGTYIEEWKHFLKCIDKDETPRVSGRDGLKVLQVIDGIRQSSLMGKVISINQLGEGSESLKIN